MFSFFDDLKRRKLVQWAVAYLAAGWAALQVLDFVATHFGWPAGVVRGATILVAVGFLAVLVVGWYHGERGVQRVTTLELMMLGGLFVVAGALVTWTGGGPPSGGSNAPGGAGASIAVLPFVPVSGYEEDEYFGDGLTEELLNALVRVEGLRVAARTSSFAFKGDERPVQEIGEVLGVAHVLTGSVRRASDGELRITAQLIDTRDGFHRWASTWDRRDEDVFEIQEEISRAIVEELRMKLAPELEAGTLARAGTDSFEAYDQYLRGVAELNRATEPSLARAVELFEAALEVDPEFGPGYVGVARARIRQAIWYEEPDVVVPPAIVAANRALQSDPELADAYVVKAFINTEYEWNWTEAERLFQRALDLAPGEASSHQWYQNLLRILGRCEEAIEHVELSARLDPLSSVLIHDLGYTYYYCRDHARAVRRYREALTLQPDFVIGTMRLGMALSALGRHDEAIEAGERAVRLSDREPVIVAALARSLADAGRDGEARELIAEVGTAAAERYVDGVYASAPHTGLGEYDEAIRWIQRAYEQHSPSLVSIAVHPWHDPLRSDPRFVEIQRRMGLVGEAPVESLGGSSYPARITPPRTSVGGASWGRARSGASASSDPPAARRN